MTQPERSALSDARMADAAVALICERGAGATTLKDVGLRAGYSRGLASYRFGSKEGLWSFLIRTIGEEWLAELQQAVAGTSGSRRSTPPSTRTAASCSSPRSGSGRSTCCGSNRSAPTQRCGR